MKTAELTPETEVIQPWNKIGLVPGKPQLRRVRVASRSAAPRDGLALTTLCLLAGLVPLVFAAPLFEPYLGPKEILIQAGTATAALLWLLTAQAKSWTLALTPALIPLLVLVLIGAASVLWSSSPSASLEEGQRLLTYVLLFAVALHAMRRAESRSMLAAALVLAGGIEAAYVLLQYSFGDPILPTSGLQGKWQTFGTLGNPNWTGEFLAAAALVSLGRLIDLRKAAGTQAARSWSRQLTLVALILMLLALAATLARGAWLAFIIGAAAFLIARRRYRNAQLRLKSSILPLAITAASGVVIILLPLLSNQAAINHLLNLKSARGRIWMWAVTWTMIRDAPWGGHGLGTFGLQFPLYQARAFSRGWSAPFIANASFTSYAHNDYLQLWAELGLFGLLAFGALIWIVLKRGRVLAEDPAVLGCWAAVISLLVNAAVAFPLHLPTTLMLFVVLVAVVEGAVSKKTVGLSNSAVPARIAIVLLLLIFCFLAYRSSYHRLASEAALWRAQAALESQRWNEAEGAIRTAIQHAPTRLEGQAMLGRLHLERGEFAEALNALDRAMKLGFDVEVYDWKATALERTGQRANAIATLNELVWLRPDLTWPRQRLTSLKQADEISEQDKR
jgi:O-antigen ligase